MRLQYLRQGIYLYRIYGFISLENNGSHLKSRTGLYSVYGVYEKRKVKKRRDAGGGEGKVVLQRRIRIKEKKRKKNKAKDVRARQPNSLLRAGAPGRGTLSSPTIRCLVLSERPLKPHYEPDLSAMLWMCELTGILAKQHSHALRAEWPDCATYH